MLNSSNKLNSIIFRFNIVYLIDYFSCHWVVSYFRPLSLEYPVGIFWSTSPFYVVFFKNVILLVKHLIYQTDCKQIYCFATALQVFHQRTSFESHISISTLVFWSRTLKNGKWGSLLTKIILRSLQIFKTKKRILLNYNMIFWDDFLQYALCTLNLCFVPRATR